MCITEALKSLQDYNGRDSGAVDSFSVSQFKCGSVMILPGLHYHSINVSRELPVPDLHSVYPMCLACMTSGLREALMHVGFSQTTNRSETVASRLTSYHGDISANKKSADGCHVDCTCFKDDLFFFYQNK